MHKYMYEATAGLAQEGFYKVFGSAATVMENAHMNDFRGLVASGHGYELRRISQFSVYLRQRFINVA